MKAYLFDVDGVLSDPHAKKVTEPELFDHIIARLEAGDYICLNTGRSIAWMQGPVIEPLLEKISDTALLERFMAIGEKGGSWMVFDEHGAQKRELDDTITIPKYLQEEARELVEKEFSHSMFFDETKETMISIEMKDHYDLEKFHADQKNLDKKLDELLKKHSLDDKYVLEPSIIATDIQNSHVGKALGADRFIEFLKTKGDKPEEYVAFGDSKSDIEMSDELAQRGEKVEFVFVGDKEKLDGVERDYPIHFIKGFTKGTLTYLQQ